MPKFYSFTKAGSDCNEDMIFVNDIMGFALDGASALLKEKVTEEGSDARWFTLMWKDYLQKSMLTSSGSLASIVKRGIPYVKKMFRSYNGAKKVKFLPSSAAAIFRLKKKKQKMEYLIFGDCSLMLIYNNGNVKLLTTETLPKLDQENLNKMVQIAKERGISVMEARPLINEDLIRVRELQNKPGGYWILSDNKKAVKHANAGEISSEGLRYIVAMTDGFSQIFDTLNIYTKEEFAQQIIEGKRIDFLYNEINRTWEGDKFCNRFPRFKQKDDAAIAVYEF